jgi:hypothetical protein
MLRSIVTQPAEEKVMLLVFALLLLLVQFVSGRRVVWTLRAGEEDR